ncbi:tRNA (adenosine(37)-N6)-dimethylallyltransferase MiaA [uncultured Veillonella sp.]|uniref:tRNA (adenosine(37)-N6)-dimethylallyltransferase MiaA n=1 Tax=uncultured Veillonella sp. TaxID=159268 RepID=UPI0025ECB790|nr:tRNA (adenosine(37)-N6)-dimethylallyltransferase MiaA [uncultured Veillonella sp.]MDY3974333.1 tRNA (adenosine(37)-N6)-dimethylallyltransferase MiaA [Veillonella caviae]
MNQLITILGPTAVGKTELTLQLAETLNSSVISGDAYQVYKGFDIGTAKPDAIELQRAPHFLIDCYEPDEEFSVALFQSEAERIIGLENGKGRIPILSGGTGFYVQSLLEGFNFSAEGPNLNLRAELDALYESEGIEGLQNYARELATKGEVLLQFTDKHRLYRAIELMAAGDYEALTNQTKEGLRFQGPVIGLSRDRAELYERINLRVNIMVEQGLFEEVEALLNKGIDPQCQAFKGIGYKEVVDFYEGRLSKAEAIAAIQQNTRRFAKRQITWYKRMPYIQWIDCTKKNSQYIYEEALKIVRSTF